jgi:hypothetical protein
MEKRDIRDWRARKLEPLKHSQPVAHSALTTNSSFISSNPDTPTGLG